VLVVRPLVEEFRGGPSASYRWPLGQYHDSLANRRRK